MVGVLVAMKWVVLRRMTQGKRLGLFIWQVMFSITAIVLSILVAFVDNVTVAGQLVAATLAVWTLGWVLGPMIYRSRDLALRIDYFRTMPLSPRRFAASFTVASAIGLPVPVTLLSFMSIAIYAWRLEPWLVFVSLPLILVQVVMTVFLAKIVSTFLHRHTKTHLSSFISSLVTGGVLAFFATGWWTLGSISTILRNGMPEQWTEVLMHAPSGWSLSAIGSFAARDWSAAVLFTSLLLLAMLALGYVWLSVFERQLARPQSSRTAAGTITPLKRWPQSARWAIVRRELLAWRRDYTRSSLVFFAFFYSIFVCLYPAQPGLLALLPFAGILFAISAAGSTANGYGMDGSMLWQLLTTPLALRHDVRGRQITWLIIITPVACVLTLAGLLYVEYAHAWWPMVSGVLVAALGAGAGLSVLVAVRYVIPLGDPHVRGEDANENSVEWGQFMLTVVGAIAAAAIPAAMWWLGAKLHLDWVMWAALPIGIAVGLAAYWLLGLLAIRHLQQVGPQILQALIRGDLPATGSAANAKPLTTKETAVIYTRATLGSLFLFPQGIVPLILKLNGTEDVRVWFLAMYVPGVWGWCVAVAMVLIGIWLWVGVVTRRAR
jgi:ABC-2 type transport system permease protein